MIFITILLVMVLRSGNLSMALIILASAFHLSCNSWHDCNRCCVVWRSCPIDWCLDLLASVVFQMRTGSHVLITRPVKFDPRLAQQFLIVKTTSLSSLGPVGSSPSHNLAVDFVSVSCPWSNLPNHWKVLIVRLLSSFLDWVVLQTY